MTHTEIIAMVANAVGATYEEAYGFAQTFIDIVISRLDAGDEVKIRGWGTFKWVRVGKKRLPGSMIVPVMKEGRKLRFIPALQFRTRRALMPDEDEGMNKYAVVTEDQDDNKTAGVEKLCPICGKTLDSGGACPEHGTEPFEPND